MGLGLFNSHGKSYRASDSNLDLDPIPIPLPQPSKMSMSTRSAWRTLHYSAKRRAFQPATPYRCFSCTRASQDQNKLDQERMTHFGFRNVPESEKESRGKPFPIQSTYSEPP